MSDLLVAMPLNPASRFRRLLARTPRRLDAVGALLLLTGIAFALFAYPAHDGDFAESRLFSEVEGGTAANVAQWLDRGADVNAPFQSGWEWYRHRTFLERLLHQRTQTDPGDALPGFTPLILAAYCRRLSVVRLLLDRHADVNAVDHRKMSALMVAVAQDDFDSAKLLLMHGARTDLRDEDGETAMDLAHVRSEGELRSLITRSGHDAVGGVRP